YALKSTCVGALIRSDNHPSAARPKGAPQTPLTVNVPSQYFRGLADRIVRGRHKTRRDGLSRKRISGPPISEAEFQNLVRSAAQPAGPEKAHPAVFRQARSSERSPAQSVARRTRPSAPKLPPRP